MKRLVIDLDDTISFTENDDYNNAIPNTELIEKIRMYKKEGFEIVISTARNMRTYGGNVGKIQVNSVPKMVSWLEKYDVPYDELLIGKPWCGYDGFYVDDKAIRPEEFIKMDYAEIMVMLSK